MWKRRTTGRRRRYLPAALLAGAALLAVAAAVLMALSGSGAFSAEVPSGPDVAETVSSATTTSTTEPVTTTTAYIHSVGVPSRIVIPAIEVDAKIVKVGLRANGNMQTPPYGKAGWFYPGPAPGAAGPAVIVAHVDNTRKADVFYRLDELQPGDEIQVWNAAGDSAAFVVDSSEMVLKVDLPTERIWPNSPEALIRLITCGGEWSSAIGHYLSNVIVYGHLVR